MFHNFGNCCKDLDFDMKNQGDKLVITISGEKEKIAKMEKKLDAMKTLCCDESGSACC
jgi:hypothetical protein